MKIHTLSLVTAAALLALTSCSDTASPSPGGPERANPDPGSSEYFDALPADLRESGVLEIGTDPTIGVPFASFADDNETMVGVDIDLGEALAEQLGLEPRFVNTVFDAQITGLKAGRIDMAISSMLDTDERQKEVDFVDFLKDGSGFLVAGGYDGPPASLDTVCGKTVGALRGGFEYDVLTGHSANCTEPIDVQAFDSVNNGLLALQSGRIEFFGTGVSQAGYLALSSNGKFEQSGDPFDEALIGIAMPKDTGLAEVVRDALQELMDSGTYMEILTENKLQGSAVASATINNQSE